jgi:dTMP kinase
MARGAFIVVEGLDRSGKTTQTELLAERLTTNGVSVERRKFPGERFDK